MLHTSAAQFLSMIFLGLMAFLLLRVALEDSGGGIGDSGWAIRSIIMDGIDSVKRIGR